MKILKAGFGLVRTQYTTPYWRELSTSSSMFFHVQKNALEKKLKDNLELEDALRSELVS